MTANIIANWQAHPVIVTIEDGNYPISSVDFPSVTICSATKVVSDKLISEMCRLQLYKKVPVAVKDTVATYFFDIIGETYSYNVYDPRFTQELGMTKKEIDLFLRNVSNITDFCH
jgi:hypothetical protein